MQARETADLAQRLLLPAWPVWSAFALIALAAPGAAALRWLRLRRSGIAQVDAMPGRDFEEYLALLFRGLGYRVERTARSGDYGGDLVVIGRDRERTVVQAKRNARPVGIRAVQEAVAAKARYACETAMVISNSTYTRQAVELAGSNGVILWDREALIERLLAARGRSARRSA